MSIFKKITCGPAVAAVVCGLAFSACDSNVSDDENGLRAIDEPCSNEYKCEQGLFCDSGLCRKICVDDNNCNGRQKCIQGICKNQNDCRSGFMGENCGQCLPSFYGPECQPCPQCVHGSCDDGITGGGRCNCEDGFFGQLCDTEATCKNGVTGPNGLCLSCEGHWTGDNCDKCATGWDGPDCEECDFHSFGPDCQPCDCANGRCDYGHQGRGCVCYNEWTGDHCDICDTEGTYADSCAICTRPNGEYDHARASDCVLVDDRQKKPVSYQVVDIDGHFWMAENLKYTGGGDYRYPNEDKANVDKYGLLYPANVGDEICPDGWRLPEWADYEQLLYLAGDTPFYNLLKNGEWKTMSGNPYKDLLGFGAMAAGMYDNTQWGYTAFGGPSIIGGAVFLSSTKENNKNYVLTLAWDMIQKLQFSALDYVSVRCIKEWCDQHKRGEQCERCETGWTGQDCLTQVSCAHGQFDSDGKCLGDCDAGWTGVNCDKQITCNHGELDNSTGKCVENSCEGIWTGPNCDQGTITDSRDKNTYKIVAIGGQNWLAQNLRYSSPEVKCTAMGNMSVAFFGCVYSWADSHETSICPSGWRLPTPDDFSTLLQYVTANMRGAPNVTAALSSTQSSWSNNSVKGMDVYGFGALPIGYYNSLTNQPNDNGLRASFWSDEEDNGSQGKTIDIKIDKYGIGSMDKRYAFPVRCVQNASFGPNN